MIILKKALPRRMFLRGMGASLALPLLDAMVQSMRALDAAPAGALGRLGVAYVRVGAHIPERTAPRPGRHSAHSPALHSLVQFVDQLTQITRLELKKAWPGSQATSNAAFL